MSTKSTSFPKPQSLIVMSPKTGRLTAVGRKVFNVMLMITRRRIKEMEAAGQEVRAIDMFEAPVYDLARGTAVKASAGVTRVKSYLLEMRSITMDWSAPDAKTGVVFKDMSLVSEVQMEIRAGVLWVRWSFPPSVIDAIATQLSWTMIDIMEMSRLESYQAVALYEIVCRYKDNPSGVTSKQSTDWWTDALSPERTEPGGTRREWRKVKYEWVNKAIEEINSKTSLNIELLEERVGRTIKSAQFKVEKKRPEAEQARPQLVSKKIAQLAALNEVSVPSLVKMLGDGYDEEVFELAFMKLAKRVNMPNLDEVRNRQKYFESMVRQTAEQIRLDFGSEPDGEPIRAQFPNIEPTPPLQTPLQLAETVSDSRRREISEEFKLLNDEEQNRFGMAAARELEQLGLMTPQVKRRVGSGQWRNTQLVFFKAIDLFGKEKYGPDWLAAAHST